MKVIFYSYKDSDIYFYNHENGIMPLSLGDRNFLVSVGYKFQPTTIL